MNSPCIGCGCPLMTYCTAFQLPISRRSSPLARGAAASRISTSSNNGRFTLRSVVLRLPHGGKGPLREYRLAADHGKQRNDVLVLVFRHGQVVGGEHNQVRELSWFE